jgi:probable F420-dependent oxidoreductase
MSHNDRVWPARLGKAGIWSSELRSAPAAAAGDAAAEPDALGFRALWIPGLNGGPVFDDAARLLTAAPNATVALGVLGIWQQSPGQLAAAAAAGTARFPGRLVTGLGVSSPESAAAAGRDFGKPLLSMSRYLDALDAAATPLPAGQRILGALGPKMAKLAADRTAGFHPFLVPARASADYRAHVGAETLLAPYLAVVPDTDPGRARAIARAGIGVFTGFPSYQQNLRRLGITEADLVPGGSDQLIDELVARGDLDAAGRRIRQHLDAGADHVALHVLRDAPGSPVPQWRRLSSLVT